MLTRLKLILQNQEKKPIIENFFSLSFLNFFNYVLPLITIPYLVRVLGPEKYGLVAFSQYLIQYFIILTDYGFNLSATNRISTYRNDKTKIAEIFYSVIFIKTILMLVGFIIILILISFIPKLHQDSLLYLYAFGAVLGSVLFPIWFYQGIEKMKYITIFNIISRLSFTLLIFLIVKNQTHYLYVPFITSVSVCFSGMFSLLYAITRNKICYTKLNFRIIKEELKEGFFIFISTLATSIYTNGSALLLGFFTNNTIVGYYAGADKVIKLIQNSLAPITQSVFPYISKITTESRAKTLNFVKKLAKFLLPMTFIISSVLLVFSSLIVEIVLGKEFSESVNILRILSFLPFIVSISNLTGIQVMVPLHFKRELSTIYIIAAIINLALAFILIPIYQGLGLGFAVIITEIFVVIIQILFLEQKGIKLFVQNKGI